MVDTRNGVDALALLSLRRSLISMEARGIDIRKTMPDGNAASPVQKSREITGFEEVALVWLSWFEVVYEHGRVRS